jgi:hypothetical protein
MSAVHNKTASIHINAGRESGKYPIIAKMNSMNIRANAGA